MDSFDGSAQARLPVQDTVGADVNGVRAKELYKYYQPNYFSVGQSSEPDHVLTAHAQLVTTRLNCDRSLVSLIDRESQYFVAEGVKTTGEDFEEEPWAVCTTVDKAGRLCERTLEETPRRPGEPAYFEVCDLLEDPRFNELPFICGGPRFRYYCGVPIITKKGIPIGSLFVLDKVAHKPLTTKSVQFMAKIADLVMVQLELLRDRTDKKRALNMNMCLAAFVDPEYASRKRKRDISPGKTAKIQSLAKESMASPTMQIYEQHNAPIDTAADPQSQGPARLSNEDILEPKQEQFVTPTDPEAKIEDMEHLSAYKRAATLLYESLSLEGGGGVVFVLDTSRGLHTFPGGSSSTTKSSEPAEESTTRNGWARRDSNSSILQTPTTFKSGRERESYFSAHPEELCELLAAAISTDYPKTNSTPSSHGRLPILQLTKLIRRYPRGRLFTLDADLIYASTPSSDDTNPTSPGDYHGRSRSVSVPNPMEDLEVLKTHFPSARQVAFVPLWDSISGCWASCFIFNSSPFRTISRATDFLYCIAFCNCVVTEISRLATLSADQQKQNFIGSISHELRSPLHGILGSMEFLNDTDCTAFQHSLIDTANSCAVTLLDTISMVLDYSKLNNFERNASRAGKSQRDHFSKKDTKASLLHPSLNIYGYVDLSVITEEVVEGVATGQEFKDIGKYDTADVALPARSRSMRSQGGNSRTSVRRADVEIIIDISPLESWAFLTQPGAFRRIVMNLFGNALKYTQQGQIKVSLDIIEQSRSTDPNAPEEASTIRLRVIDTGQGISPHFMRSKLFTPFSQENTLNPGTGLGLSLVKEIITMLDGDISMQSEVGVGTEVTVTLPMSKTGPPGSSTSNSTPNSSGSVAADRGKFDSIGYIRNTCKNFAVAHFWKDHPEDTPKQVRSAKALKECLTRYFVEWYGFSCVVEWQPKVVANVVLVDEIDLQALLRAQKSTSRAQPSQGPLIIVLCTNASRHASVKAFSAAGTLEFVSLPVGPYKLATALKLGFEKIEKAKQGLSSPGPSRVSESSPINNIVGSLDRVTLAPGKEDENVNLFQQGDTLAREDSGNAQMAMMEPQSSSEIQSDHTSPAEEYPFPSNVSKAPIFEVDESDPNATVAQPIIPTPGSRQSRPPAHRALSSKHSEMITYATTAASPTSPAGALAHGEGKTVTSMPLPSPGLGGPFMPRLLLVDDNKVNLRLLQTYMTKSRKVPSHKVILAEDGRAAVTAFQAACSRSPPAPPHIVFMDLSMPILDGFAATREIREAEAAAFAKLTPSERPAPALIIALTGLASERDQSEAFLSGFDLYMTKPVSFKEVGRLLDNWTANGGAQSSGAMAVPHGSLTGLTLPDKKRT